MARLDYSISATAIGGATVEGQAVEVIDQRVNRSLSGGNSAHSWDNTDTADWTNEGVHTHVQAYSTPQTVCVTGDDMLWIKHTGKRWDNTATEKLSATSDDAVVVVYAEITNGLFNVDTFGSNGADATGTSNVAIGQLATGECMVIPEPKLTIKVGSAGAANSAPAVEYAAFK